MDRILIADDEPSVRDAVGYALRQEGFEVTVAVDGVDADGKLGGEDPGYDLLILDIMMPGRSGLDICRDVRARSPVPIILLTAKDQEVDKVVGLRVGADDYITKPFSPREVLARVRSQLKIRRLTEDLRHANRGLREPLHFWRDNIGTEVDVIIERGTEIAAVEIKSGPTVASDAFGNLNKWRKYATERGQYTAVHPALVYGGDARFTREGVDVMPWCDL